MFADVINLIFSHENLDDLISLVNCELNKFSNWFKFNKLSININKTNFSFFSSQNKKYINSNIIIDHVVIQQVWKTKFIGVILNHSLSWNDHILFIKRKVRKSIGIILPVRHHLPRHILLSLYRTLIHPYFEYCNIVWAVNKSCVLDKLFICQKRQLG